MKLVHLAPEPRQAEPAGPPDGRATADEAGAAAAVVAARTSDVAPLTRAPCSRRRARSVLAKTRAAGKPSAMSGTWAQEKAHFGIHPAQFIDDVANVMLDCARPSSSPAPSR